MFIIYSFYDKVYKKNFEVKTLMMLFQSTALILACCLQLACLSSYQTILRQDKENFYIFVNRSVSNGLKPLKVEEHEIYPSCITACQLMTNCVAISIVQQNLSKFECRFFDGSTNLNENTEYVTSTKTYLVKKGTVKTKFFYSIYFWNFGSNFDSTLKSMKVLNRLL